MSEQLAAIRARRAAITPGVWEVGSMYTTGDAVVGITDNRIVCVLGAEEQCHADATFIAAAPGDIDTLLAMVEQRDARIDALMAMWQANTDALAAVTAEREALREQLQQAQRELAAVPVMAINTVTHAAVHAYDMRGDRADVKAITTWLREQPPA